MLSVKFKILRLLNEEINRLESIRKQVYAGRDYEKRKEYEDDLKWCKNALATLRKEFDVLSEKAYLSKPEKAMAYAYYCKGMTWGKSFDGALDMFTAKELEEYDNTVNEMEAKEAASAAKARAKASGKARAKARGGARAIGKAKEEANGKEKEKKKGDEKARDKYVEKFKKSITRKIQSTFNYYRKAKED